MMDGITHTPAANSATPVAANPLGQIADPNVFFMTMPPELRVAVQTLYARISKLDAQAHTKLGNLTATILEMVPVIDGQENNIRQMARLLADSIHASMVFKATADQNLILRFVLQNEDDLLGDILPENDLVRVIVAPVDSDVSWHATTHREHAAQTFGGSEAERKRFVLIADPSPNAEKLIRDTQAHYRQQLLLPTQFGNVQKTAYALSQTLAASADFSERPFIADLIKSTEKLVQKLNTYQAVVAVLGNNQQAIAQETAVIQTAVQQVETQLKALLGSDQISDNLHQTIRSGVQAMQQARAEGATVPQQMTRVMAVRENVVVVRTPIARQSQPVEQYTKLPPEQTRQQQQKTRQAERPAKQAVDTVAAILSPVTDDRITEVIMLPFEINQGRVPVQDTTAEKAVTAQILPFRTEKVVPPTTAVGTSVLASKIPVAPSDAAPIVFKNVDVTSTLPAADQKQAKAPLSRVASVKQVSSKVVTDKVSAKTAAEIVGNKAPSEGVSVANNRLADASRFIRRARPVSKNSLHAAKGEVVDRKHSNTTLPSLPKSFGEVARRLLRFRKQRSKVAKAHTPEPA